MDDRRQDEGQNDRSGREQRASRSGGQGRYSDEYGGQEQYGGQSQYGSQSQYDESQGQRGVATRSRQGSEMERTSGGGSGGQGDMRGYVLPYRYYGPGYRGVGYYAVFYQGSDPSGEQEDQGQQGGWSELDQGRQGNQRGGWGQSDQSRQSGMGGRSQGGYAGRGPKGYQRSDERLREEISDQLMADDRIDASDIEIEVRSSEVTLTGTVPDRWMKRQAEDLAEQVMGVREVMNQLRVQRESDTGSSSSQGSSGARTSRSQQPSSKSSREGSGSQTQRSGSSGGSSGTQGQSNEDVTGTTQQPAANGRRRTATPGSR
jgi:osmotically-inducible protein OsmY